jgi:hypothetical protein
MLPPVYKFTCNNLPIWFVTLSTIPILGVNNASEHTLVGMAAFSRRVLFFSDRYEYAY